MPLLNDIGRLPVPTDNCAIAIQDLEAGTVVAHNGGEFALSHNILVGHRFAIQPIAKGEQLLSWGQSFGFTLRDVQPGEYMMNTGVKTELSRRNLDFELPEEPNFDNEFAPYAFEEEAFQPADPISLYDDMRTFMGYAREGGRGVGTRNMIVVLGTSSLTAGFVRTLAQQTKHMADAYDNVDSIVPIAHTEGGHSNPNNRDLLLRTLAGFMTHPNVGAVVAIDYGSEAITNETLREYMQANGYSLEHIPHHFYSLSNTFEANVEWFKGVLQKWLPQINATGRTPQPLSELKIALQCGGSDAFSGVSGNPLAAWVAKEVIRYGGSANLAETDELIGSESYVLDKVENIDIAHKFLAMVERFKERVSWHGQTAEGNPSGGNKYRGLYNIYLKSLGAAAKRHPDVPLHAVIDYSEKMTDGGFYFMDSPGNDLESIAGQVASGCNMIFFVTGNGSITNFPFVPTIKIVTTTDRYNLLQSDMDVNAGAYLDGTPIDEVGAQTLDLTVDVANGQHSVGEAAGHYQVQLWRDWEQTRPVNVTLFEPKTYDGKPLKIADDVDVPQIEIPVFNIDGQITTEQIGLIMPTSLCSGQIARMTANTLNAQGIGTDQGISRFVTLVHTEGCGGTVVKEYKDTLMGYLSHPKVRHVMMLEHGCEITHNSYFRQLMAERNLDPQQFGWASIQLDGGIDAVMNKIDNWFTERLASDSAPTQTTAGFEAVRIALISNGDISDSVAHKLATLTKMIIAGGGTVVVSDKDTLLNSPYVEHLGLSGTPDTTLDYGQRLNEAGFHIMTTPRQHWSETLTGLGATGVELMVGHVDKQAMAGHPLVPVLQVTTNADNQVLDLDAKLSDGEQLAHDLLDLIVDTLSHKHTPKHQQMDNHDFQITRGLMGVSF
jgi:altronate dehydratase